MSAARITRWIARRSGGYLTIAGLFEDGTRARITGVHTIAVVTTGFGAAAGTRIIATDKLGTRWELLVETSPAQAHGVAA